MDNELLDDKFNDIDEKVDFLIELCQTLQLENDEMKAKLDIANAELEQKNAAEVQFAEQQAIVRSKIDGLLSKLNHFSENA